MAFDFNKAFQEDPPRDGENNAQYYDRLAASLGYKSCYIKEKFLAYQRQSGTRRQWMTTRRMTGPTGNVIHEVQTAVPQNEVTDLSGFEAVGITSNPFGGQWVRYSKEAPTYHDILDRLETKYKGFKPPKFDKKYTGTTESCAIINMFDAHLDKIAVKAEVGYDSSLEDNVRRYKDLFTDILLQVSVRKPELIIFPVGNDLFHTNAGNRTKKGTPIQYLCSEADAYEVICDVQIWAISMLMDVCPVKVPFIKGNHDEDKVNTLAFWIGKMFGGSKHFDCDRSRMQRKYVRYGANLFGFAHGDKEKSIIDKLPLLMAEEAKQDWSDTRYRKWYCGDLHHNFEFKFLKSKDQIGCSVEFLRSVGVSDGWHNDHGYIGIPITAEAHIWDKQHGNIADLKVNAKG